MSKPASSAAIRRAAATTASAAIRVASAPKQGKSPEEYSCISRRLTADSGRAAAKRGAGRGYTFMEVMMALGVLAVGATGIVAMEKAAVVGNASARSIATATAIANRWAERLRVDSMLWNNTTPLSDIGETRFLKTVDATPDVWTQPSPVPGQVSPTADPLGADILLATDTSPVAYCTHISYRYMPPPDPQKPPPKMINAIVRVAWRRDWSPIDCLAADMYTQALDSNYGAVYLTVGFMTQERAQ